MSSEGTPRDAAARVAQSAIAPMERAVGDEERAVRSGARTAGGEEHASPVESIFVRVGEDRFEPTEHARGPWDPSALHGGAPAALMTAALEHLQPGAELPFARLHFEFLRPVPLAPLQLSTRITRPGRRVQALEAELRAVDPAPRGDTARPGDPAPRGDTARPGDPMTSGEPPRPGDPARATEGGPGRAARAADAGSETTGVLVCRAQALRIQPVPGELPPRARRLVRECSPAPLPPPAEGHGVRFALDDPERRSFAGSATEMRFVHGHPLKGALPDDPEGYEPVGASAVWMRLRHPLLPDEPTSALARVPAAADFGNGVAAVVPFDAYLFINADLTVELDRRPEGEWIGLDARTLLHADGIGWAESVLHDELGPLGRARQTLVVQPR